MNYAEIVVIPLFYDLLTKRGIIVGLYGIYLYICGVIISVRRELNFEHVR